MRVMNGSVRRPSATVESGVGFPQSMNTMVAVEFAAQIDEVILEVHCGALGGSMAVWVAFLVFSSL